MTKSYKTMNEIQDNELKNDWDTRHKRRFTKDDITRVQSQEVIAVNVCTYRQLTVDCSVLSACLKLNRVGYWIESRDLFPLFRATLC